MLQHRPYEKTFLNIKAWKQKQYDFEKENDMSSLSILYVELLSVPRTYDFIANNYAVVFVHMRIKPFYL